MRREGGYLKKKKTKWEGEFSSKRIILISKEGLID
jgi:hypothetical protein